MDTEQHVSLIDIPTIVAEVPEGEWVNRALTEIDGAGVRLGVIEGEYHWHVHQDSDELFMTLDGVLEVEVRVAEGEFSYVLGRHQMCVVPAGVEHRTCANERTTILMIERAGVRPEGD
jgi:mannose-6-phosphate isomerase-like protein (cupin superfamily)